MIGRKSDDRGTITRHQCERVKGKGTSCALTRAIQRHDALAQRLGAIKDGLVLAAVENRTLIEENRLSLDTMQPA